jgi:glucose-1-phosphate thymidylyltransferase
MASQPERELELIGLIPAGGHASRIAPSPCSKEIFPVGFRSDASIASVRPKVVSHYLLEKMHLAGVSKVFFILRQGKWDIPAYYGDGSAFGLQLGYLMMGRPHGPPYTLDQAYPFARRAVIAFGFPDILFTPDDAFVHLLARQRDTQADVVLALLTAHAPEIMDMVEVDASGRVLDIVLRPGPTTLRYAWIVAVWSPVFTEFLHRHLAQLDAHPRQGDAAPPELTVGHVLRAAVEQGLRVEGIPFPGHTYLDVGTPEGLSKAFVQWTCPAGSASD